LTTHLEAVQARKVLPCVDHPAFKAVFNVRVRTDANLSVISNMPIESETKERNKKTVTFEKTPKMSTYLLYLGVGKFVQEKSRHGATELYAAYADRPTGKINTEFSFDATRKVLDYYESYFGIPFQLPKLHNVAVPEFAYGAMGRDALTKTHPIMAKVHDPEEIDELFDEISYGKGASILRMIEAYIGSENFKKGVAQYLQKFRYSNASGHDLWSSLQEASRTDVSRIMEGWISQEGFPVIKASLVDGRLTLEQE